MEGNQVFVKIDDYKSVADVLESIRGKLSKAKDTLLKIQEIKKQEDAELELWGHSLDEVEHKVEEIDAKLMSPTNL